MADNTNPSSDQTDTLKLKIEEEGLDVYPESFDDETTVTTETITWSPSTNTWRTSVDFPCIPRKAPSEDVEDKEPPETLPRVKLSDLYDIHHSSRGDALVINQQRFSYRLKREGYTDRDGSDVDGKNIKGALQKLGFQVSYHTNVSAGMIRNLCKKMAEKDHSNCDCFACVILSHGEDGIVFGTDAAVEIKEITDYFKADNCSTLVGKPKLFFIQACRGSDTDPGIEVDVTDARVNSDADIIKLPIYADFLFAYSTVPGYYSWRNGRDGSWFIQALCKNIEKYGNVLELQKLLIRVNRDVAQKFESFNPECWSFHRKKQVSCSVSMLTKDLYFTNKA